MVLDDVDRRLIDPGLEGGPADHGGQSFLRRFGQSRPHEQIELETQTIAPSGITVSPGAVPNSLEIGWTPIAYTEDTVWRNRAEFLKGREEVRKFLQRKWARELGYRLVDHRLELYCIKLEDGST